MRYVESTYEEKYREETYRIYVTDALRLIGKLNIRYAKLVHKKDDGITEKNAPQKAAEIKQRIFNKLEALSGG